MLIISFSLFFHKKSNLPVCTPPQGSDSLFMVTNVKSLNELKGCNVINGSLDISIKGGSKYTLVFDLQESAEFFISSILMQPISHFFSAENVLHELESAFQELEEIRNYLKITRSYPILTLGFLRNLKFINGSVLDRSK